MFWERSNECGCPEEQPSIGWPIATNLARWALRSQWPDPEDQTIWRPRKVWLVLIQREVLNQFCREIETYPDTVPLHARIQQSAALSLIMTDTRSRLPVSNNSGQFEVHLLNSNAPNFNSWMISSRISFNSSTVSVSVSMSSYKNLEGRLLNRDWIDECAARPNA